MLSSGGVSNRQEVSQTGAPAALRAAFVVEQTLGHVTHTVNLTSLVPEVDRIDAHFLPVPFEVGRFRMPGWTNWTIRAGVRARRLLAACARDGEPEALFVHTQVPGVLLGRWMRRIPSIVSIDATPEQYDSLGEFYAHARGSRPIESVKHSMNARCFQRARHLVTWSEWAKRGLQDDYGVDPGKITVVPPGVDVERWRRPDDRPPEADRPLQILFVGGDLRRKGGDLLLAATRRLRKDPSIPEFEVHLVTSAQVAEEPGVVIHAGVRPNTPELLARYHAADVFCLPTLGDCLPMVLAEAAAAGLPLISTDVGAISEIVQDGRTGVLLPTGDEQALESALRQLLTDPQKRRTYGAAARALAESEHDARKNATTLVRLLRTISRGTSR